MKKSFLLTNVILILLQISCVHANAQAYKYKASGRVIAIGDLHGDYHVTIKALQMAGAIDQNNKWIGKDLTVVQTGDQLDRGDGERKILDLLETLQKESKQAGGQLIVLNGNHEIWNIEGYFYSVTDGGYKDFADFKASPLSADFRQRRAQRDWGRLVAFAPKGPYARKLASHPVIAQVNDTLFAHGGVTLKHVKYGIDKLNQLTEKWINGELPAQPAELLKPNSPTWVRRFSIGEPSKKDCAEIAQVLKDTNAKRMVVGHTIQPNGISSACNNTIWRIDVGLSNHYNGPIQILDLTSSQPTIIKDETNSRTTQKLEYQYSK